MRTVTLKQTCAACPEQYDAFLGSRRVGYLRLRHGFFAVYCPDAGGERVLGIHPEGDGMFTEIERSFYLRMARIAIGEWLDRKKKEHRK